MKPTYTSIVDSDLSYADIQGSFETTGVWKSAHASAKRGAAIFIYRGCSRSVLSIAPGGESHVVAMGSQHVLHGLATKPGLIYIMVYAL